MRRAQATRDVKIHRGLPTVKALLVFLQKHSRVVRKSWQKIRAAAEQLAAELREAKADSASDDSEGAASRAYQRQHDQAREHAQLLTESMVAQMTGPRASQTKTEL